jgi:hypothetical protein
METQGYPESPNCPILKPGALLEALLIESRISDCAKLNSRDEKFPAHPDPVGAGIPVRCLDTDSLPPAAHGCVAAPKANRQHSFASKRGTSIRRAVGIFDPSDVSTTRPTFLPATIKKVLEGNALKVYSLLNAQIEKQARGRA